MSEQLGTLWILLWERSIHIHDWIHLLRTRRRATSHRGGPLPLLFLSAGPFSIHYISHRINRERKAETAPSMLRVPSNWFQSGPPIRSPNKTWGKHFHSNYTAAYTLPTCDHVTPWTPITQLRFPRLRVTTSPWSFSISVTIVTVPWIIDYNYCVYCIVLRKICAIQFYFLRYIWFLIEKWFSKKK